MEKDKRIGLIIIAIIILIVHIAVFIDDFYNGIGLLLIDVSLFLIILVSGMLSSFIDRFFK